MRNSIKVNLWICIYAIFIVLMIRGIDYLFVSFSLPNVLEAIVTLVLFLLVNIAFMRFLADHYY